MNTNLISRLKTPTALGLTTHLVVGTIKMSPEIFFQNSLTTETLPYVVGILAANELYNRIIEPFFDYCAYKSGF